MVDRDAVVASILDHLLDPGFRRQLTAGSDKSYSIVPALLSDRFSSVLDDVQAVGGSGNLIVPVANGYAIIGLVVSRVTEATVASSPALNTECTIGVLLARLIQDSEEGDGSYVVYLKTDGETARAELAGLAC